MRPIHIELITIILTMIATGVVLSGSAREALSRLNAALDGVRAEVASVQVEVGVPRNEVGEVRTQVNRLLEVKPEETIDELRGDVSELQGGMCARFGEQFAQAPETPEG